MIINLMTFNIQHGRIYYRDNEINLDLTANAIMQCAAEIVALNEVRDEGSGEQFTAQAKQLGEYLGYHWYFAKAIDFKDGPYGNALLSKYPIIKAETYLIEDPAVKDEKVYYETRCILKAVIDIPGLIDGLTVFVSHFGLAKEEQRNAVAKLKELLRDVKGACVFMGDLNVAPDNEIIKPLFSKFKDTAVSFDSPKFSFPSDEPKIKIDYIFVDKNTRVCSADIPPIVTSDHRPYIASIEI